MLILVHASTPEPIKEQRSSVTSLVETFIEAMEFE
jgi:hypothetical protein